MLTAETLQTRHTNLYKALKSHGLTALALNPGPSLVYLTGLHFHLSERPIVALFAPGKTPIIVLPELETGKLENLPFQVQSFAYGEDPQMWERAFQGAVQSMGLQGGKTGVEARRMRVLELHYLHNATQNTQFLPAEKPLAELRMYKDETEAAAMRAAARIAEAALQATLDQVQTGMTENDLASELVVQLLRQGSQPRMPFSPIVSFGPNSANPHAFPTGRELAEGDLLLVDWGAAVDDYYSDITRTFAVGELDDELARIADIVQRANQAARAVVSPGARCSEVDLAARQVIQKAGYGEYFFHRTGHGLGMEAHEEPYIREDNDQLLEPGMTFTIEPGVYLPGRGGVRIEDDVLVTHEGVESFTSMPRELRKVG